MNRIRTLVTMIAGTVLLATLPATASAEPRPTGQSQDFCWDADANFAPAGGGTHGRANVLAHCEAQAQSWRIDVYVNGEWWAYSTGGKIKGYGEYWLGVDVPRMPKPNDKRGNFVWAKVTYKLGTWENVYREELGWFPCKTCTD
ncbi:hypothetical protein [Kribbella speibonae]|uniref:Secreted protein n=1 Tax=Kribbella speibonae TaxID=1572660 RepID=A0ABY2A268_9ACTN|nr:hypothetical protein [Kribbella speibonae]TCC22135.1 hypothetical protein E0H58_25060 [Kribbella speibonae]